jgi:LysR family glycine cleavage system transcriptional activator
LHAFLIVARSGGFGAAAALLNLSQSSISRQIARLEEHFHCMLFERHTRRVILSESGQRLLPFAEQMLVLLEDAEKALGAAQNALTLRVHPTIATRWLMPRLPDFYRQYPEIRLHIDTRSTQVPDFVLEEIDAMIDFGAGPWSLPAYPLWREQMTPVCRADLFAQAKPPRTLAGHVLLHTDQDGEEWRRWAQQSGVELNGTGHLFFDMLELALLAARQGQGIALADSRLTAALLQRGELVQPYETLLDSGLCYCLVFPQEPAVHSTQASLRDWLLSQAASSPSDSCV